MDIKQIFDYLTLLKENNNREWYHSNKEMYKKAHQEFEHVIEVLISEIGKSDISILHNCAKDLTFKVVRDTRYSFDKSPYNPAFRAHISSKGKLPIPVGYFIRLKPDGQTFLGGGLFADMFKDATNMIRTYISNNHDEWNKIINEPNFKELFEVKGEALKNVPKEYNKEHPQAEFLKNKSWYLEYFMSDNHVLANDFISNSIRIFLTMKPFNDFLNKALINFEMPKRK